MLFFVDTNVFLEPLLGQENGLIAEQFVRSCVVKGIPLACTSFSIHAIEAILSAKKMDAVLEKFLLHIKEMSNLTVVQTTVDEELDAIRQVKEIRLDFDDSLQYLVAKKMNCEAIVSFDHHFDKTDLLRKEPQEFF